MDKPRETDLYAPVKSFLEGQGYAVKGEIGAVDVVAIRGEEEPVLVELKLGFSLALVHQGLARQKVSDLVYLAIPKPPKAKALKDNTRLCRQLGLGLLTVRLRDGFVEPLADPGPFTPRKSPKRKARLLREFARRVGDPNKGGATKVGIITSYRQDALKCAGFLKAHGPSKGLVVAKGAEVPTATRIMAADHYGWFERVARGVYGLTKEGIDGMDQFGQSSFKHVWRRVFGDTPPLGYKLREDFLDKWTRFHALPKSKRYADTAAERQIIRDRARKLASACFGESENLWLVLALSEYALASNIGASAISRYKLVKAFTWEDTTCEIYDRIPMTFFACKSEIISGKIDWLIDQVAENKLRAVIFEAKSGNVLAPYDGGFDVFCAEKSELTKIEEQYSLWMSDRTDKL